MNNKTNNNTETIIHDDENGYNNHYMPSTSQQYVISWLQIGPSILSLLGSYLIIYNIRRNNNIKSSPYRRIMLALSVCTILSTFGWMLEPFLVPAKTEENSNDLVWVYAMGNHATCVVLGAISQFSIAQHLFLAFLSLYFLVTVKFGMTQRNFVKYEKWIHASILVFACTTSLIGIVFDYFRPNVIAPGCWINPPTTKYCNGFDCPETRFAFAVGVIPFIASLLTIFVSNAMLYSHVRSTVVEAQKKDCGQ